MRLIIVPAVDQRTEARDHLNHGGVKGLPERIGRQIRRTDVVFCINHRCRPCLSGQIHIRFQPHAEQTLVIHEPVFAQLKGHIHQYHVAGTLDPLLHGKRPVAKGLMAGDIMVAYMQKAFAVIGFRSLDRSVLQRRRDRKRFRHRPRLVSIRNAEVLPQRIELLVHGRIIQTVQNLLRHAFTGPDPVVVHHRHTDQTGRVPRIV